MLWKYDPNGNLLWLSRYRKRGPEALGNYTRVRVGQDGRIVVGGTSNFKANGYHLEFLVTSLDQNIPRLALSGVPLPGTTHGCLVSERGQIFDILANTNVTISHWQPIGSVTNYNGVVPFSDSAASEYEIRYYRAEKVTPHGSP